MTYRRKPIYLYLTVCVKHVKLNLLLFLWNNLIAKLISVSLCLLQDVYVEFNVENDLVDSILL